MPYCRDPQQRQASWRDVAVTLSTRTVDNFLCVLSTSFLRCVCKRLRHKEIPVLWPVQLIEEELSDRNEPDNAIISRSKVSRATAMDIDCTKGFADETDTFNASTVLKHQIFTMGQESVQ